MNHKPMPGNTHAYDTNKFKNSVLVHVSLSPLMSLWMSMCKLTTHDSRHVNANPLHAKNRNPTCRERNKTQNQRQNEKNESKLLDVRKKDSRSWFKRRKEDQKNKLYRETKTNENNEVKTVTNGQRCHLLPQQHSFQFIEWNVFRFIRIWAATSSRFTWRCWCSTWWWT